MLVEMFRKEALQSFAKCVRKFVKGIHLFGRDTRMKIVESGFVRGGFCRAVDD